MSGHAPETAEVAIVASATGTRQVQELQAEIGRLNLSTVELNRQQQRFTNTTLRQAESFGKTKAEVAALRAEQLGLGSTLGGVIHKWREAEVAGAGSMRRIGQEAKHAEGGIKGLLSNARVFRELIVLMHESLIMHRYGRFGGSLMVLAEYTNATEYLFTAAAGVAGAAALAVGGFTFAMVEGEAESLRFARAIQMTGDASGVTEDRFRAMAETIGHEIPGSVGEARTALLDLIRTGQFSGNTLSSIGRAAVEMSQVTGEKIGKVVADFAHMGDGVAKWAAKANQQYHFLTLAQYDYIAELEQQGQKEQAEKVAADALYSSLGQNAPQNLGLLTRAWYDVRDAVAAAWDAMKSVGRAETIAEQIKTVKGELKGGLMGIIDRPRLEQQLRLLEATQTMLRANAGYDAYQAGVQQRGISAEGHLKSLRQSLLKGPDLARQHVADIRRWIDQALAANPHDATALYIRAHWQQVTDATFKRYAGAGGSHAGAATAWRGMSTSQIASQFNSERQRLLDEEAKLQAQLGAIGAGGKAPTELASLNSDIATGKLRGLSGSQAQTLRAIAERDQALTKEIATAKAAAAEAKAYRAAVTGEGQSIAGQIAAMRQNTREIGMTTEAKKLLNAQLKIEAWARKEIAKYPDHAAAIRSAAAGYEGQIAAAMGASNAASTSGIAGTKQAFADFLQTSDQTAAQVHQVWSKVWGGLTDQLTAALTGQKTSLRAFAYSIFTDLTHMVVQDAIVAPLASMIGSALGLGTQSSSASGFFGDLLGFSAGAIGGGATSSGSAAGAGGGMTNPYGGRLYSGSGGGSALGSALGFLGVGKDLAGIGSSIASAYSGSMLQSAVSWVASLFADGGIMTSSGPLPLNRYAGGGIANSPQVALFGEGRMPEAYVPLPDGRSIPVQVRGGGRGDIHIHNHTTINHAGGEFDHVDAARKMHENFRHLIQKEIIRQRHDGGLLATNGTGSG